MAPRHWLTDVTSSSANAVVGLERNRGEEVAATGAAMVSSLAARRMKGEVDGATVEVM